MPGYVGKVGRRVAINGATLTGRRPIGTGLIKSFRLVFDVDGHVVEWFTATQGWTIGTRYSGAATVTGHSSADGVDYTTVTRARLTRDFDGGTETHG